MIPNFMRTSDSRLAGLLLLVTAVATVVSVAARVSAGADQPTLAESLAVIAQNLGAYHLAGAAGLVSGAALATAGLFVYTALKIPRNPLGAKFMAALFVLSGLFTACSGAMAITLAQVAPGVAGPIGGSEIPGQVELAANLRWLTGSVGFTAAGLALGAAGWAYPRNGRAARMVVALSAAIGVSMLFIWVDAATAMHRFSGIAFLLWLLGMGILFLSGGPAGNKAESTDTLALVDTTQ